MPTKCCILMEASLGFFTSKSQDEAWGLRPRLKLPFATSATFRWSKQVQRRAWIQEWWNRLHHWVGGIEKSLFKGVYIEWWEQFVAISCNLPQWNFGNILLDVEFCKCVIWGKSDNLQYNNSIWGFTLCLPNTVLNCRDLREPETYSLL